jgi:hypothetical protein
VKRLVLWTASAVVSCSSLAVVVGSSSAAGAPAPAATVSGTFLPGPGHIRLHAAKGMAATDSSNWSGYVQVANQKDTFTEVSDTIIVPAVEASPSGTQYAADWVGIGGYSDRTLVQDGIQTVVTTKKHKRVVAYDAWTEVLPQSEKALSLAIKAGDAVTATVWESAQNTWTMTVDDTTTGQSQSRTVKYRSKGLSAEAIHERPCLGACGSTSPDLATLAKTANVDFGPGTFSEAAPGAALSPTPLLKSVNGAVLTEIEMVKMVGNNEQVIASPSAPDTDDDAFAVAYGPTAPPALSP